MPIGQRSKVTLIGTFLQTPVSMSFAYEQVQADPTGSGIIEQKLVESWIGGQNAPWNFLRAIVSEELRFTTAIVKNQSRTAALSLLDVVGYSEAVPLTSDTAIMVEIVPRYPNKYFKAGRMYIPGMTRDASWYGGVTSDHETVITGMQDRFLNLRQIPNPSITTWRALPHIRFGIDADMPVPFQSGFAGALVCDPIMRRLKVRKFKSEFGIPAGALVPPDWGQLENPDASNDPEEPIDPLPPLNNEFEP